MPKSKEKALKYLTGKEEEQLRECLRRGDSKEALMLQFNLSRRTYFRKKKKC
jgi:hypothetical protein